MGEDKSRGRVEAREGNLEDVGMANDLLEVEEGSLEWRGLLASYILPRVHYIDQKVYAEKGKEREINIIHIFHLKVRIHNATSNKTHHTPT